MGARGALVVSFLVGTCASAAAGVDDPEIRDSPNDVELHTDPVLVNVAVPEIDIHSAWVSVADVVAFGWHVPDMEDTTVPGASIAFALTFEGPGVDLGIASTSRRDGHWRFLYTVFPVDGEQIHYPADGAVDVAGGTVAVYVDRELVAFPLTKVQASSILVIPDMPGGSGGAPPWFRDFAPDEGYGRDVNG